LRINQTTFWKGLQTTQSGGSRYESGRNIPASVRALVILVFGAEQHARQQLQVLRDPGAGQNSTPQQPEAPAMPPSPSVTTSPAVSLVPS
jgi:hypothetical protein